MGIQVINRDGQPEYAVVPWEQYQALLKAAGQAPASTAEQPAQASQAAPKQAVLPALSELAHLRVTKGIAPEALARNVGISPAYLAMIEAGEREPGDAILRALAWHLGVPGWSQPS
ncbi:helix-turn-helix domain-containing protein [Pseudomonas cremoricolorata]|uniref:helix-turn-helix domain-containing protein n=1 Tax=Pseudomonas cremoricolorata TaxID=157783 RepID=UPI00040FEF5B|nr:helix-turn-helix transcriptional regulator [Pseudomonas cremoricolorata]